MGRVKHLLETCLVENTRSASYNLTKEKGRNVKHDDTMFQNHTEVLIDAEFRRTL